MAKKDNNQSATAASAAGYHIGAHRFAAPSLPPGLYLVATPIGNLGDITIRALETMAGADILACEDTRMTRILLDRYGINRRLSAYHEHNEATASLKLVEAVSSGKSVALVSDAGTPLVSDPGYRLVQAALEAGVAVIPIPGPSAVMTALQMSGLPSDSFAFAGFLPVKSGQRKSRLHKWTQVEATTIFFESPRRLAKSLADMAAVFGDDRQATVCREMTKKFEEARRGTLGELAAHYADAGAPKGEIVIAVAPGDPVAQTDGATVDALLAELAADMPAAKAAAQAARQTGLQKQDLYRRLVELKQADG